MRFNAIIVSLFLVHIANTREGSRESDYVSQGTGLARTKVSARMLALAQVSDLTSVLTPTGLLSENKELSVHLFNDPLSLAVILHRCYYQLTVNLKSLTVTFFFFLIYR